jgi:WD40 repeat protein
MSSKRRSSKRLITEDTNNSNNNDNDHSDKKIKYNDENVIENKDNSLSDYEKLRMANIQKNQDFLSSLGIDAIKPTETMIKKSNTTVRGSIKKKGFIKVEIPTRRSGRVTIDKLSSEIKLLEDKDENNEQLQQKKVELEALIATKKTEGTYGSYEPNINEFTEDTRLRKTEDYISMIKPSNADDDDDNQNFGKDILNTLKSIQKKVQPSKSKNDDYVKRVSKLSVSENDFAKVTEARITSIWAHPSDHKVIVAAGDKTGCVGIWDVNSNITGNGGVYRYNPHASNVISLYSDHNEPSKLYSGSYDGTIRCLDLVKESFSLVLEAEESIYDVMFKDIAFSGNKAYIGTKGGEINFVDLRVGNKKYQWSYDTLSDASLNSVQIHPTNDNYIISAGLKGITQVHDLRNASKKWKPLIKMEEHTKSVNAAYVSPDGKYMASVGLDDTIRIWTDFLKQNYPKPFVYRHDNFTGRWLSVFKPSWDPKHPHSFILGSMEKIRNVEIFSPIEKDNKIRLSMISFLSGGYMNSVVSRN